MKRVSILLSSVVVSACAVEETTPPPADGFRIQYDRWSMFEVSPAPSGATAEAELARGAIHVNALDGSGNQMVAVDGTPIRYTCGAILVAPSYIITAGHCVSHEDILDPETTPVTLEMYPVEADLDWESGVELTTPGDWWEFEHDELTAAEGYHTERFDCRVMQRCGTPWGPEIACNEPQADVALLRCEGEPGDKYGFVPVASTDIDDAPVFMPWAHEVYDFEGFNGDGLLYDHYTPRDPVDESIHYFGDDRNQLLPLRSVGFWVGDLFFDNMKLGWGTGVRWTDLVGCHGTSGSPVLQWNETMNRFEYLGPIAQGHFLNASVGSGMPEWNQLCQEPALHDWGEENLAYSNLEYTQLVAENANDCSGLYDKGPILQIWCILKDLNLEWEELQWPWDIWPCLTCPPPWVKWAHVYDPLIQLDAEHKLTTPMGVKEGTMHRVSALVVPVDGKEGKIAMYDRDGNVLASVDVREGSRDFIQLEATVQARGGDELSFVAEEGTAFVTRIAFAPVDVANGFERMVDRVGVSQLVSEKEGVAAVAMRFAAEGEDDFAAILRTGERMVMTREAVPQGVRLSLTFASAGRGQMRAGFLLADGTELAAEVDAEKERAELSFDAPQSPAVAVFIDGVELDGDVAIDDVLVGGM